MNPHQGLRTFPSCPFAFIRGFSNPFAFIHGLSCPFVFIRGFSPPFAFLRGSLSEILRLNNFAKYKYYLDKLWVYDKI